MVKLLNGDCACLLKTIESESVDLTVTSPPYDNLRDYNGFVFDFETIAKELFRVTKKGGVVVWIVNDSVVKGSETLTSFKQALFFKEIGFNVHDTMIWHKESCAFPCSNRYDGCFEYMFVFSKGKPKTANIIKDKINKFAGTIIHTTERKKDGSTRKASGYGKNITYDYGRRHNVWEISTEKANKTNHPAVFPQNLVRDHMITWSNVGDTVLDPFLGSGTTGIVAIKNQRKFIGIEISKEYYDLAKERIDSEKSQQCLFDI